MTDLILHPTPEQRQRIENTAHQRGFETPDDYLLALAEMDAQGKLVVVDADDLTQEELEANFRQGLHEALTGQIYPIEKLWDTVDDD